MCSVPSTGMAFFSESRIRSLTNILGHSKLRDLIEALGQTIHQHAHESGIRFRKPDTPPQAPPQDTARYIAAYFQMLDPLSPFLDRGKFEQQAFGPQLPELLVNSAAFSALYHTVLALGCQYAEAGSFAPHQGKAWEYFQVALGLFPEILVPPGRLVNVQVHDDNLHSTSTNFQQALTAMALFASSFSCIQIGETFISEAARMVQVLGYNAAYIRTEDEKACRRVFWAIYWQEKVACFFRGRASTMPEYDIGCPVPNAPEAVTGQLDWLLTTAGLGRLMSRMYECLFSVSAVQRHKQARIAAINSVSSELEAWACSLPPAFQPSQPLRSSNFNEAYSLEMGLQLRFVYHALMMSICRLRIHLVADQEPGESDQETKRRLMETARDIIYHCCHIKQEAYVPVWELAIVPISALFVIFDFVIHNPFHKETNTNLAFLDIAAGYFSRWEIANKGSLPASNPAELSHIAREFVQNVRAKSDTSRLQRLDQTVPATPQAAHNVSIVVDPSQIENEASVAFTDYLHASSAHPDSLFYPDDPLQPILGTSMLPAPDLAFMFNGGIWSPHSPGF
ncbi:fungal specific transcription factor domain-containing protein [Aspergillus ibericus CBS 121593]|uniref:Xylanolytic transcriptional activator regulatory domain-containing protein n=1 Tax=Aspergillus ibericus CBS 121593 TaxID=1448316 RepID=A0A395H4N8_9EURO|nr:hypothetical protein BO80DRAFT_443411 [Aspergillus ibericus CBS 121593]RAL02610.1 hypothetical protein BO80DRAFT_443411 [Aspergillus ibericus CBS 121593]